MGDGFFNPVCPRIMSTSRLASVLNSHFSTTRWSLVLAYAGANQDDHTGHDALAELCRIYWRPVYAFISKRGHSTADAQDLTQDFFVHLLECDLVRRADRDLGRFRSLLLKSLQNFLNDTHAKQRCHKRGGHIQFMSWDDWMAEASDSPTVAAATKDWSPEKQFDLQWAATVVGQALRRLREECESRGHRRLFEQLSPCLTGERAALSYTTTAATLNLPESSVKNLIYRLRQRYGALLREQVAETLQDPADVEEEVRYLCAVLAAETE